MNVFPPIKFFKFALVGLAAIVSIAAQQAQASVYNFTNITNNVSDDLGSQLSMEVTETTNGALFAFKNNVGTASSITGIYFDDMDPRLFIDPIAISAQSSGVSFILDTSSQVVLPGGNGNPIGFVVDDSASATSGQGGVMQHGVNYASEWISFLGVWAGSPSFNDLLADIDNGGFRVGLHVQSIGTSGNSDSYLLTPPPPTVPLPAAAWLFGSALLGFITLSNRRKV